MADETLVIKLTSEQKELIEVEAQKNGLPLSSYVRHTILKIINEKEKQ